MGRAELGLFLDVAAPEGDAEGVGAACRWLLRESAAGPGLAARLGAALPIRPDLEPPVRALVALGALVPAGSGPVVLAARGPGVADPSAWLEDAARSMAALALGLLLATQSPGDFDYKCRENIRSWFVGRVAQQTALAKLRPMLSDCRVDVESQLPGQSTGQFRLIREGAVIALQAGRSLVATEQLAEDEILALARRTRSATGPGPTTR